MSNKAFLAHKEEVERELFQVWMPHDGQMDLVMAFLIDWVEGVFLQCGRKYGKTDVAIALLYLFGKLFENAECYYIADEKDHARKILWENGRLPRFFTSFKKRPDETTEEFQERRRIGQLLQKKWVKNINNQEMIVTLDNDSKIMVDGAKNYSKADGLSPVFVVYDEFKHHDERFDIAMRPNLRALKGRILVMGTPPDNEENYYVKISDEFKHKPNHKFFNKPSWTNNYIYDGPKDEGLRIEEEEYRRRGEWHIFAREYLGLIVPDEQSMIFPMLRREHHVGSYDAMLREINRSQRDWEFYVSFDPASTSVFGVLIACINRIDKRIYFMDEIYENKTMNTRSKLIFERAREKWREINAFDDDWYKIYDYAAAWFNVEVQAEFDENVNPCVKDMKNKEANLSVLKDALIYGKLLFSDRCVKTFWEYQVYKKNDKGIVPKENDHNIDNSRYILNAAYYTSVPKNVRVKDDDRRGYSLGEDFHRAIGIEEEILMGGGAYYED